MHSVVVGTAFPEYISDLSRMIFKLKLHNYKSISAERDNHCDRIID